MSRVGRQLALLGLAPALLAACAHLPAPPPLPREALAGKEVLYRASEPWMPAGVRVEPGQTVEFWATGQARVASWSYFGREGPSVVEPGGTYLYPPAEAGESFPLAAGDGGPAPLFALLGKVGEEGAPFLIGERRRVRIEESGEIHLGINDFDVSDNDGAFRVAIQVVDTPPDDPPPERPDLRAVIAGEGPPRRVEDARALIFYVDGLRYDALKEMAFAGYLPNIKRIFFDGGTDVERTFTIGPSNTVPCSTAFLTGSWPDRSGIRTQMVFDRKDGSLSYLLRPLSPADVGRRFDPAWWQGAIGRPGAPRLLSQWVEESGRTFRSTVLPVLSEFPPDLFFQRMANIVPPFGAHLLKDRYIDRVQTAFALERVVKADSHVMMVWYTGVDTAGHHSPRGVWGRGRGQLALIDSDIGKIEEALAREGIADKTYRVLFADHGSEGGKTFVSQSYDLADDFFYRSLADGDRDGRADPEGGLGLNVLFQIGDVPLFRRHTDLEDEDFVVCAAQAYSAAWVALPRKDHASRDWSEPNTTFELASYGVHPGLEPVDLPERLLAARSPRPNLYPGRVSDHPVGLVLVPMPPDRVLVLGQGGTRALIERRRLGDAGRRFEYRYRVIERLERTPEGVRVVDADRPSADPLGLLGEPSLAARFAADPGWPGRWRDDREWLEATAGTAYPDGIVGFAHQLLDDPADPRFDPSGRFDLFVVASRGWNFGAGRHPPSTDHGSPRRNPVQIPFLVAGPNIAAGARVTRPARIIDILPTILDMVGIDHDPGDMDGRPVREIWAPPEAIRPPAVVRSVPFHTDHGLAVPEPDPARKHGAIAHDDGSWYDLHNLSYGLGALTSLEILGVADLLIDVAIPGDPVRPLSTLVERAGDAYHRLLPEGKLKRRPAQLVAALRPHTITIGEMNDPVTSLQHLDRAALALGWTRAVLKDPFEEILPEGVSPLAPVELVLAGAGEVVTGILWVRRALVELLGRGADRLIGGAEGAIRWVSDAAAGESWETPRFAAAREHDP